jgi:hypothetical protein
MTKQLPVSLTERLLDRHHRVEPVTRERISDPEIDGMVDALAAAREAAQDAADTYERVMLNPMKTRSANLKDAAGSVDALFARGAKRLDAARDKAERSIAEIEKRTAAPPEPTTIAGAMRESEIRATLAAMSVADRTKAVATAIDAGDDEVIGSLMRGPAMLSGIGSAERLALQDRWRRVRHPDQVKRVEQLKAALSDLDRASALFSSFTLGLVDRNELRAAEDAERLAMGVKVA